MLSSIKKEPVLGSPNRNTSEEDDGESGPSSSTAAVDGQARSGARSRTNSQVGEEHRALFNVEEEELDEGERKDEPEGAAKWEVGSLSDDDEGEHVGWEPKTEERR